MKAYQEMIETVLTEGSLKQGRNGETLSYFNYNFVHNLADGFPLLTTKYMNWTSILAEFLWILSGVTHIRELSKKTKIWNAFANDDGEIESPYGYFLRHFPSYKQGVKVDQLTTIIKRIKANKNDRRLVMTSWFPDNALQSHLPPCHFAYVFNVTNDKLNLHVTQRSGDLALGIPYDIAIWSLMLLTVAHLTKLKAGSIAFTIIDAHIYVEHINNIAVQMSRPCLGLPAVELYNVNDIDGLTESNFKLKYYESASPIKFEMKE